ncbi:MAG: sulfurtransferase TusA family protein [Acidobacteriota bacterium]|nr:sulfurtransferase TusA family protein [Acidobacteriota bacterium]MDW3229010.1 sulfurtransferase TusA family protein [Acidobacteriota bacterium]MDY0231022.1 sulfurtransferase TusA family protein [Candidatus Saccharicenans sp.]
MSEFTPDVTLDNSGLACPMPIIKTKKAMDSLQIGQILKMIATDPGSISDVQAWVSKTGQELLKHETEGNKFVFYIRKAK